MERKIDYEMAKTKNEGLAKILKMEAQSVLGWVTMLIDFAFILLTI